MHASITGLALPPSTSIVYAAAFSIIEFRTVQRSAASGAANELSRTCVWAVSGLAPLVSLVCVVPRSGASRSRPHRGGAGAQRSRASRCRW